MADPVQASDADLEWSAAIAARYSQEDLNALCAWLDTNLDLNQQRLESVTTRIGLVVSFGVASVALMAATVDSDGLVLTVIASLVIAISMALAVVGLHTVVRPDRDPTTTYRTMWDARKPHEVSALLYRRRTVLFKDQRRVIESRAAALKSSSWVMAVGALLTVAAIIVSRAK